MSLAQQQIAERQNRQLAGQFCLWDIWPFSIVEHLAAKDPEIFLKSRWNPKQSHKKSEY